MALISMVLISCGVFGTNYVGSIPKDSKKERFLNVQANKIEMPGIVINLRPRNEIQTSQYACLSIIPIYISTKDRPKYEGFPFVIRISLKPNVEGICFDPKKVILELDGNEYSLVGITGHITTRSDIPDKTVARWLKQGAVVCSKDPFSYTENKLPEQPIKLNGIEQWHCYDMFFDAKTPSPEQKFSLKIYGIVHGENPIEIPKIDFIKAKWSIDGS